MSPSPLGAIPAPNSLCRREALAVMAAGVLPGTIARAQGKMKRLAVLATVKPHVDCFLAGLKQLGWEDGKNLDVQIRLTGGEPARGISAAQELLATKPDLIAVSSTSLTEIMMKQTSSIPIIFMAVSDPVQSGFVKELRVPDRNATGISNFLPATSRKLIELINASKNNVKVVGLLFNSKNPGKLLDAAQIHESAEASEIRIIDITIDTASDVEPAMGQISDRNVDALIVLQEGISYQSRNIIIEHANRNKIPTIFQIRDYVDDGGLMSYGLNFCAHFRHASGYVDKLLRGASVKDLPVELPTTFEFVINLKTAKLLGLEIPVTLLSRADEVIE